MLRKTLFSCLERDDVFYVLFGDIYDKFKVVALDEAGMTYRRLSDGYEFYTGCYEKAFQTEVLKEVVCLRY